jgi:tetratricopeptide (TPR) repeat protein
LALRKAKLGPDHPDTLSTRRRLAYAYAVLGRYADAVKLGEEALALFKARLGSDHPDTISCMNSLTSIYYTAGRYADCVRLGEQALALAKAKLGPDHPSTLNSANSVATAYANLGRYADALKLHEETVALKIAKLGPNHPDTLLALYNIACCNALMIPKSADRNKQADLAMECLKKAVAAGYKDLALIKKDTDLNSLRSREDFKKLLAKLEGAKESEKPKP